MTKNDGRGVKQLWWNGTNGDELKIPKEGQKMIFRKEFYGDHDEDWVCLYADDGIEIERHNAKFIASIIWA